MKSTKTQKINQTIERAIDYNHSVNRIARTLAQSFNMSERQALERVKYYLIKHHYYYYESEQER